MSPKENSLMTSLAQEFEILKKYPSETKKINKFVQGYNL